MSLDNLPVEWTKDQLANLVNFIDYRGKTPTKTSEGIPLITAKNIRELISIMSLYGPPSENTLDD
jgi:type I restriction enzyme, S subunit